MGFVTRDCQVSVTKKLFFAIAQGVANRLLHLRIVHAALACSFAGNQLEDANTVAELNRLADLTRLEREHRLLEHRVGLRGVQRGFWNKAEVATGGRGIGVFGIVHSQLREVRATIELVHQHFGFALGFGFIGGVVILAIADLRFVRFAGFLAWIVWAVVHIYFLIGFTNRFLVMVRWGFAFLTKRRQALIFPGQLEKHDDGGASTLR